MSVNEYVTRFNQLSRYAPNEVDTDEKNWECFLNGLNDGLTSAPEAHDFENFEGMANMALVLVHQHQSGSNSRVASSSIGHVFCPAQPQFLQRPQPTG
jgi:hypothetical protein